MNKQTGIFAAIGAAIGGFLAWALMPTPAGICRNILAQMTQCIAAVPHHAPLQCQMCLDEARGRAVAAGVRPEDCGGPDAFEPERSCF